MDPYAIKTLAEVPTLAQLYLNSSLVASPSKPLYEPSAAVNASVGFVCGDITKIQVGAIVNAANSSLLGGGGVDGSIHRAAGHGLVAECKGLGGCRTGQAKLTGGYNLPAQHVIHTVGPVYDSNDPKESKAMLRSCYEESMKLASQNGIKTLAFPCVSTGIYRFPAKLASEVACDSVRKYLDKNKGALERVVFVTYEPKDRAAYNEMLP